MHIHKDDEKLFVFDFDQTLCISDVGIVYARYKNGEVKEIPGTFIHKYTPDPEAQLDFSDIAILKNPRINQPLWAKYVASIENNGNPNVWICTARGDPSPIVGWLAQTGVKNPQIACMSVPPGTNYGISKSQFITEQIASHKYKQVEFYDDLFECAELVHQHLSKNHSDVQCVVGHVVNDTITYL